VLKIRNGSHANQLIAADGQHTIDEIKNFEMHPIKEKLKQSTEISCSRLLIQPTAFTAKSKINTYIASKNELVPTTQYK
jgi:hypothetical protein